MANNLFECDYPKLENIVWASHPVTGVKYNNYGHIENDDDFDARRDQLLYVYEAFHKVELKPFTHIGMLNMNPYDTRIENLFIKDHTDSRRQSEEKKFVSRTVRVMEEKAREIRDIYGSPEEYFRILGIPNRFIKAYTKKASKK